MGKFKVGDHLKGTDRWDYSITNKNLIDAEVLEALEDENSIRIKCIRFLDGDDSFVGLKLCVNPEYFEYADGFKRNSDSVSGTVSSFVINGQEYTKEQYEKDCERFLEAFPDEKSLDSRYAMENILNVYQWAQQNPVVTNLDHYAEEFGWTEEQKKYVLEHCPFPFVGKESKFCPKQSSGICISCEECREWWNQTWKGAECTIQ